MYEKLSLSSEDASEEENAKKNVSKKKKVITGRSKKGGKN